MIIAGIAAQRQSQGQGQGSGSGSGGAGGGEHNFTLSELIDGQPDLLNQFLKEAVKLLDELGKDEKKLSFISLLANVYIGDDRHEDRYDDISEQNLVRYFKKDPRVAVRWLTIIAKLFPDTPGLNSCFLSEYKEALSTYVFPPMFNENNYTTIWSKANRHRFGLLRHACLSNEFFFELYKANPFLKKYTSIDSEFRERTARPNELSRCDGVFQVFIELFSPYKLKMKATERSKLYGLGFSADNDWLTIYSQVLQELRDSYQEEFVNVILVGLGPRDREIVVSKMEQIEKSSERMEVDEPISVEEGKKQFERLRSEKQERHRLNLYKLRDQRKMKELMIQERLVPELSDDLYPPISKKGKFESPDFQ